MSYTFIDRTLNGKRISGSRQKFIRRVKKQIKSQVNKQISEGSVDDLVKGKNRKIAIPKKDLSQPTFNYGSGGKIETIRPGNKKFVQGDRIPKPQKGPGEGGKKGSADGKGEVDFVFTLTQEEFVDLFFSDCELPDLQQTIISQTDAYELQRSGITVDGNPSRLNIPKTMVVSKGRRIGLFRLTKKEKLKKLEQEVKSLEEQKSKEVDIERITKFNALINIFYEKIKNQRNKLSSVPFIDNTDLRYNNWETVPIPTYKAVMINIMDVSASMGEWETEMAKRFFMMMYLFLTMNYERVDVVWIRHHTTASEVNEEEFFKSRETGGTKVSTAFELANNIIKERYPLTAWNIYTCQSSDGDNWAEDTKPAIKILTEDLLPLMRYFAYIEVNRTENYVSDLWPFYEKITETVKHFQIRKVYNANSIYPVFKELFRKK